MTETEIIEGVGQRMWAIKTDDGALRKVMTYREDLEEFLRLRRTVFGDSAKVVQVVVVEKE